MVGNYQLGLYGCICDVNAGRTQLDVGRVLASQCTVAGALAVKRIVTPHFGGD